MRRHFFASYCVINSSYYTVIKLLNHARLRLMIRKKQDILLVQTGAIKRKVGKWQYHQCNSVDDFTHLTRFSPIKTAKSMLTKNYINNDAKIKKKEEKKSMTYLTDKGPREQKFFLRALFATICATASKTQRKQRLLTQNFGSSPSISIFVPGFGSHSHWYESYDQRRYIWQHMKRVCNQSHGIGHMAHNDLHHEEGGRQAKHWD